MTRFIGKAKSSTRVGGTALRSPKDIRTQVIHASGKLVIWAITIISCAHIIRPPEAPAVVLAPVLETKIFVKSDEPPRFECVAFDVPQPGEAILKVVNGAKIGAKSQERPQGAEITLNGNELVNSKKFKDKTNVLDISVKLQQGMNRLCVKLLAKPSKRLAVRIDAPIDKIVLTPVFNPIALGRDPLRAQAKVTGLGLPTPKVRKSFEVSNFGSIPAQLVSTDAAGTASTFIRGFTKAGIGRLSASVVRATPLLSHEIPIQAVKAMAITLNHHRERVSIKEGQEVEVDIAVNVLQGKGYNVKVEQKIEPDSGGIKFTTDQDRLKGDSPKSFVIKGKVSGIKVGTYTVTTTATIEKPKDKWSDKISIRVVNPDAAESLVIYAPSATPRGIFPKDKATPVTFRASVAGTSKPPEILYLHEVDDAGQLKIPHLAVLRDDGKEPDDQPGDLTYAGALNIASRDETTIDYRLRVEYLGKTVLSAIYTFHITRFPLGIRSSDPSALVNDPDSNLRLFSNEVVLGIRPGVPVDRKRIEEIADAAGGIVVGFSPPLRLYLIEIPGDGSADGVQKAINAISVFGEIEYAEPNHETIPAAFPADPPNDPNFLCRSDPSETKCQWYLEKIGAPEAWKIAGGGKAMKVALIEADGMVHFNHLDLQGQQATNANTTGSTGLHATQVAGLIAAKANNAVGIAGVAYESRLLPYDSCVTNCGSGEVQLGDAIRRAADDGAKIINISQQGTQSSAVKNGLDYAINDKGALVVASAGNQCNDGECKRNIYPAKYNQNSDLKAGLLIVGATDRGDNLAVWTVPVCGVFGNEKCSSNADWIDLYSPGKNIYSITNKTNSSGQAGSGTSFAAALTSGAAAVLWASNPSWKAKEVHDRLIFYAEKLPGLGTCDGKTCGRLNLADAVPRPPVPSSVSIPAPFGFKRIR